MIRALNRIVEALSRAALVLAGIALLVMMVHIVADVVAKYAFRSPIIGTIEVVAWYYMVIIAMAPVAYVQLHRQHLMVELFTMKLSPRQTALLDLAVGLAASVYTGLLTWLVWHDAARATRRGRAQDLTWFDLPTWPSSWVMPLAFGLLTCIFLLQSLDDGRRALGKLPPSIS